MINDICGAIIDLLEKRGPIILESGLEKKDYCYIDAGHVDSISLIQFILEVEEIFGISFTSHDTNSVQFRNVLGLTQIVENKVIQD